MQVTSASRSGDAPELHVRVVGPETPFPPSGDLRRLFAGRTLSRGRRARLRRSAKVVALRGPRVMGLAAFDHEGDDLRVCELALEADLCFSPQDILAQLIDALELACLASGAHRVVLLPEAVLAIGPFERLGYRIRTARGARAWFEKHFS